jgi:hypothetical protein
MLFDRWLWNWESNQSDCLLEHRSCNRNRNIEWFKIMVDKSGNYVRKLMWQRVGRIELTFLWRQFIDKTACFQLPIPGTSHISSISAVYNTANRIHLPCKIPHFYFVCTFPIAFHKFTKTIRYWNLDKTTSVGSASFLIKC